MADDHAAILAAMNIKVLPSDSEEGREERLAFALQQLKGIEDEATLELERLGYPDGINDAKLRKDEATSVMEIGSSLFQVGSLSSSRPAIR